MFNYESGLLISFLIWICGAANVFVSINSRYERNLNRIGQRLSWLTLTPKPMTGSAKPGITWSKSTKYLLVIGIAFPFIFLSWIQVGLIVAGWIYKWTRAIGTPQPIKEFRWKMRNIEMSFDQIAKEMMKLSGDDAQTFPQFRESLLQEMRNRGIDPA